MGLDTLSALRSLRRRWCPETVIWCSTAVGVAVFLALASIVDGLLLREPFAGAERIAVLGRENKQFGITFGFDRIGFADASRQTGLPLVAMGTPQHLGRSPAAPLAAQVSTEFFDLVRVRPVFGRTFSRSDEEAQDRAVISETLWRAQFGSGSDILDKPVLVGNRRLRVVGVVPDSFAIPAGTRVWTLADARSTVPHTYRLLAVAPDDRGLSGLAARLPGWHLVALRAYLAPADSSHAVTLLSAGGLLLLTVWTYVGLLQASRVVDQVGQSRLKVALGAGRLRAIRGLLIEGYLSLVVGLFAGVALAPGALAWIVARLPAELVAGHHISFGYRGLVVALCLLVIGCVAVTAVVLPAMKGAIYQGIPSALLGRGTLGRATRSTRWIVAAQFAVATPVLYGFALATHSFYSLVTVDLGFRPENVLSAHLPYVSSLADGQFTFEAAAQQAATLQALIDRVHAVPGIERAAVSNDRLGFSPTSGSRRVRLADGDSERVIIAQRALVSREYFRLMQIPVIAGTTFEERIVGSLDLKRGFGGVVVDTTLAHNLGAGANIVGQQIIIDFTPAVVIGVVAPVRARRPDESIQPRFYMNVSPAASGATNLLVRFTGPRDSVQDSIKTAVREVFGAQAPADIVLLSDELTRLQAGHRGRYELLSLMGWIACTLCVAGTFGVGSYAVARRRRELAVRMAVGASRYRIVWTCLGELVIAAAVGGAIGILAGAFLGSQAAHLLYGVAPVDPAAIFAILVLLAVAVIAGGTPAVRDALRTDVSAVLRQE